MTLHSTALLFVAVPIAVLTTMVTAKVLRHHLILGNPMIPICTGLLCFFGLCGLPDGSLGAIPLLYAALGIAILVALIFAALFSPSGQSPPPSGPQDILKSTSAIAKQKPAGPQRKDIQAHPRNQERDPPS